MRKANPAPLADGTYWATCKERNALAAAMNGHGTVFPRAAMIIKGREARFYRDSVEVWRCNAVYAATHFTIDPA
ncbi:hypothetical protein [Burkholderia sp. MBR-1]|uniref:hypothetical protein n=1 Tax=Burkholderia sp. MBR-1 TaxID=2732364 RepID=UPI0015EFD283|nr:hypothetical protein [Burkholderia sp. MBR-1]QMI49081.1 hypothetical protein MBR110_26885 [Burkholderia sp. MBR-1]